MCNKRVANYLQIRFFIPDSVLQSIVDWFKIQAYGLVFEISILKFNNSKKSNKRVIYYLLVLRIIMSLYYNK